MQRKNFSETEDGNVNDIGLTLALYGVVCSRGTTSDIERCTKIISIFNFRFRNKWKGYLGRENNYGGNNEKSK